VLSSQHVRRGALAQALRNTAWQFAGSWVLTGETPSYRGVSPRAAFDPGAGSWGAFELTVRYASLAIDADTFPVFANPATSARGAVAWAAGLNWILNQGVKVQVNYERTRFLAPGASSRPAEHDLLTRIQLAF